MRQIHCVRRVLPRFLPAVNGQVRATEEFLSIVSTANCSPVSLEEGAPF